ncbi:uncharacterized protein L969DRAFT_94849 [Mixia osmundae IAM 14324]|uniref:Prefoldin subunit 1 n=1 Tax=Mixia osmundae (strain CBS 9802 / IAM 14324 / JCM 22182 / KY 12970) TaxID=764103 RepID=G7E1Y0_MIXOS|nr:uncharacterized protein L969DRAFT_94849 [Mixia osmundae IAM 14324]KEI38650.1 hypothetical protein L969DRAFT_94849 [Mixia osmundae IAM 14324]GAA96893.1 hypothetical protein E5Q_03566 [Mixia osmundae IAM 14324]
MADNDALRNMLEQLHTTTQSTGRQLKVVRGTIQSLEKETKLVSLTQRELATIPLSDEGTRYYKGVGKMFMQEPRKAIDQNLATRSKEAESETAALRKRQAYLDRELQQAQRSLQEIYNAQSNDQ